MSSNNPQNRIKGSKSAGLRRVLGLERSRLGFLFLLFFFLLAISFSLPAVTEASTIKAPPSALGLVGYWPMNEGVGTLAGDASGNGNTGTLSGSSIPTWTTGKRGNALNFNGTSAYVAISDSTALKGGSGSITLSAWYKRSASTGAFQTVIGKMYSVNAQPGYLLTTNDAGQVLFETTDTTPSGVKAVSYIWNEFPFTITSSPAIINAFNKEDSKEFLFLQQEMKRYTSPQDRFRSSVPKADMIEYIAELLAVKPETNHLKGFDPDAELRGAGAH